MSIGLLGASCFLHSAYATNGYSPTGFGTINKGMVGAGVALPQDAMAAATNPAGMGLVGNRTDVGVALFSPSDRGYTANTMDRVSVGQEPITSGTYYSENDYFLIPHFGWNKPLTDHSSIGVSIGGNGGMNTEYDTAVFGNFGSSTSPTGVDFAQLFLGVSYAHEVSPGQWLGVMPIAAVQRFKAEGLESFDNENFSSSPGNVTNNDYDMSWGYGIRVGWLGKITDQLSLAASYQSRLNMSEFDDYKGLFAEQGDFDTPSTWVVGLAYTVVPDVTLVFDYQRINYGEVKSLANGNDLIISSPEHQLGADEGLGFGWEDMNIYKFGVQWEYDPKWTFRAGYSHASELFKGTQALFNILAPATIRDHFSLGSTYSYSDTNKVNMSLTRAFNEEIKGTSVYTGGETGQTGSVQMEQWEVELSWTHMF